MLLDQLFAQNAPNLTETSDYARRRAREEAIISGQKPARKRQPAQTSDYARRREQEKKKQQGVAEGGDETSGSMAKKDYSLGLQELGKNYNQAWKNNPWKAELVDRPSFLDFEVQLTNPLTRQQINFILRPVDMTKDGGMLSPDTFDVRDLQTGETTQWFSGYGMPLHRDAAWEVFEDPAIQKDLRKILNSYIKGGQKGKNPPMLPGLKSRSDGEVSFDADDVIGSGATGIEDLPRAVAAKKTQDALSKAKQSKKGVAEGHADQQRKIFKKNGKPVGEVGIDRESSPGVGQYYMKCYATGDDLSGYDSYEEAVAELKHCLKQGVAEGQEMSLQQLATISDEALDNQYHYGRSTPGNTFGWQANLMSAAYAKRMIDAGVTDIEKIADAIHKGWNVTAQKFVANPDQFDDTEKLRQAGKLDAKLQQRAKLMKINYAQLDNEEQEKDRVVARALLQAMRGQSDLDEGNRFDEPLTGYHIVYRKSGQVVHATPSFETRDAAQKYLMTRMFANHQDYRVAHTAQLGLDENLRDPQDNPCWKGYYPVGTKQKNGRTVPNCVPKK